MKRILSTYDLTKIYPGNAPVKAVENLTFDLHEGEILGLLGPNGSGKTTTIQMLLGTLKKTSGRIEYFDMDFEHHRSQILEKVSFASTYTSLPYPLTIKENLNFFGCLYGYSTKESQERYDPLLERFGIADKKMSRVSSLSAGQVTRLMLVKAFFINPRVVLLDEPTASLDPDIAQDICDFLLEQRDNSKVSILFTSHKMDEVMEVCDRAIFLKNGKIIANDLPEKLAKSASAFKVKMIIIEGLKRTMQIAEREKFQIQVDHRCIEVYLEEEKIPFFLQSLSDEKVCYSNIIIEEPSLEDFFISIAKNKI